MLYLPIHSSVKFLPMLPTVSYNLFTCILFVLFKQFDLDLRSVDLEVHELLSYFIL